MFAQGDSFERFHPTVLESENSTSHILNAEWLTSVGKCDWVGFYQIAFTNILHLYNNRIRISILKTEIFGN